ncbi:hypothetical protein [Streptomyces sp. G1]|uniref:hypothetical protein n=1 Tax=Streptomyces sp. G1 TaxID=361572 RepID=UPI00202F537F|nr:hypothetical protein [Streptomyces sp. G1]MCM1964889.1 hypothetical protein [Streptomyces sp. G1]
MTERKPRKEARTMVTFTQAAERLVQEQVVRSMTPEGLRKLARTDVEWPLNPADYGETAGARTFPYEVLLKYMNTRSKRKGRGPAKRATPAKPAAPKPGAGKTD